MKDTIVLEFNQEDLDEYIKHYFKLNPRCRKVPIEEPMARSLNKMLVITNRVVQNTHKQNYKKYAMFIAEKYNFKNLGISSADLHIHFCFKTAIRHDLDNFIGGCKEFMDGLSEIGMIVDDDYSHIKTISASAEHRKGVTKMTFTFNNVKYDLEELKITQEKERVRKEKLEDTKSKNKKTKSIKKKTTKK